LSIPGRFFFCIALVVFASFSAHADEPRVLLVHSGAGELVAAHLVDELVALGIAVEVVPAHDPDLLALGRARQARAVLRVAPSRRAVDVWVQGSTAPESIVEPPDEPASASALALRVVESLRGRLMALKKPASTVDDLSAPPPPEPMTRVPTQPTDPLGKTMRLRERPLLAPPNLAAKPAQLSLRFGPSVVLQPASGSISPAGMALVAARWAFWRRIGADLFGLVPVVPAKLASPDGVVLLSAPAAFAGGSAELLDVARPYGVSIGLGVGVGALGYFAQPGTPRVEARDGSVLFALPYARAGFWWRPWQSIGFSADALGAVATPRPVIHLLGRTDDTYFGQPLVTLALGLWVALR
jgi:hypothetical protein